MKGKRLWITALVLALVLALLPARHTAWAATVTVNSTTDVSDGDTSSIANLIASPGGDGVISLREAITAANNTSGDDTIAFNIPAATDPGCDAGTGVCTIQPTSVLPVLSGGGTTIDGYTQPGAVEATDTTSAILKVEIDGTNAGAVDGFTLNSSNNLIRGLAINRFWGYGVLISGSGTTGNTVSGNYIGTDADGTLDRGNNRSGVRIRDGAHENTVGGDAAAERNVISANGWEGVAIHGDGTTGNTISGNYIGTDASGTADLGNTTEGVYIYGGAQNNAVGGSNATPGGTCGDECNVISGNNWSGVSLNGSGTTGNVISGNYIGTDAGGTADLGNSGYGVHIQFGAQDNTVGGDTAGERNVLSGNDLGGVYIRKSGTTGNTVSGNYIGTAADGTLDLGNTRDGVYIHDGAQNNTVGGDTAGERNVISGNDECGVHIADSDTTGNVISGNYIGTDADGTLDRGNSHSGVYIHDGAQNNTVGGSNATPGGACSGECNVISGNDAMGVHIVGSGTTGNIVSGNHIGTDANGTADLGNTSNGVYIYWDARNNTVGGDTAGERNVISGNDRHGVRIAGSGATGNTISGNHIGTDASGTAGLGNDSRGVYISNGAQSNTIGPDNVIAHNGYNGVEVDGSSTTGNTITQNSIFSNDMGIDLTSGANGDIAAPVIVTTTVGSVNVVGTACAGCTVEVFENSDTDGEGETYVGDTTATASGAFTVTVSSLRDPYLTATATDAVDGTSEFSAVFTSTVTGGNIYLPIILRGY
jgi:hypothetical protein